MGAKKWLLLAVGAGLLVWIVVGFVAKDRGPDTGALARPPDVAHVITQGNMTYYTDSYQLQGGSVVLSDYYQLMEDGWRRQRGTIILAESAGAIKIRRLDK
jgi:hypothetical protein